MIKDTLLDKLIIQIVQKNQIIEQIDLQKKLKEEGYNIPQATLSRRLKKLNIVKIAGIYKLIIAPKDNLPEIINMQIADSGIIVLHTQPSQASSLAYFLDQNYVSFHFEDNHKKLILGTIAGDDTVMVIIKNIQDLEKLLELLYVNFPYLKENL